MPWTMSRKTCWGAKQLYDRSASRFKPYPNFIKGMRKHGTTVILPSCGTSQVPACVPARKHKHAWFTRACQQFDDILRSSP